MLQGYPTKLVGVKVMGIACLINQTQSKRILMFIHTRDTIINIDMLEAVTISGLVITYHMANNDIEINYGSVDAAQRALSDLTQILKD